MNTYIKSIFILLLVVLLQGCDKTDYSKLENTVSYPEFPFNESIVFYKNLNVKVYGGYKHVSIYQVTKNKEHIFFQKRNKVMEEFYNENGCLLRNINNLDSNHNEFQVLLSYNEKNQIITEESKIRVNSWTKRFIYNSLGNIKYLIESSTILKNKDSTEYFYEKNKVIKEICKDKYNNLKFYINYKYNENDSLCMKTIYNSENKVDYYNDYYYSKKNYKIEKIIKGNHDTNFYDEQTITYKYNIYNQLIEFLVYFGNYQYIYKYNYEYNVENKVSKTQIYQSRSDIKITFTYSYDNYGNIKTVEKYNGSNELIAKWEFEYD